MQLAAKLLTVLSIRLILYSTTMEIMAQLCTDFRKWFRAIMSRFTGTVHCTIVSLPQGQDMVYDPQIYNVNPLISSWGLLNVL